MTMSTSTILAIFGGAAGLVGSIITAYGANNTLKAFRLALDAHDLTLTTYLGGQRNVPLWGGLPKHNAKAMARDARLVLAVIRKRSFLSIGRHGFGSLA